MGLICDQCRWRGEEHQAQGFAGGRLVCPACWRAGYDSTPREAFGPLIEAFCPTDPGPRQRKAMADWTEEEWDTAERTGRARDAHERSLVLLKTTVKGARQIGFGFLRAEFKVKGID